MRSDRSRGGEGFWVNCSIAVRFLTSFRDLLHPKSSFRSNSATLQAFEDFRSSSSAVRRLNDSLDVVSCRSNSVACSRTCCRPSSLPQSRSKSFSSESGQKIISGHAIFRSTSQVTSTASSGPLSDKENMTPVISCLCSAKLGEALISEALISCQLDRIFVASR